jgi:hypothetical protein
VPPDLSRTEEATHEENLLIEAVSLLVQRQRETESWVAEQVWQAEERATATERRYADLETRLTGIEDQLERLTREIEPGRSAEVDERVARLREQVEGMKTAADGRSMRAASTQVVPLVEEAPVHREPEATRAHTEAPVRDAQPRYEERPSVRPTGGAAVAAARPQGVGFLELLGSTPDDRWGFVLIVAGGIAVLYAVLTQLFR